MPSGKSTFGVLDFNHEDSSVISHKVTVNDFSDRPITICDKEFNLYFIEVLKAEIEVVRPPTTNCKKVNITALIEKTEPINTKIW